MRTKDTYWASVGRLNGRPAGRPIHRTGLHRLIRVDFYRRNRLPRYELGPYTQAEFYGPMCAHDSSPNQQWLSIQSDPVSPNLTAFYLVSLSFTRFTRFNRFLPGFIGFYQVLLGFTGFQWVLLGFTGCYCICFFSGFHQITIHAYFARSNQVAWNAFDEIVLPRF